MIRKIVIFYSLLNVCLAFAAPVSNKSLKVYGRALANYQVCSQIAEELKDKVMLSYYAEMFNDSRVGIKHYSKSQSRIITGEFNRSIDKLAQIDKKSMAGLCLKRFDFLSREMQKKKLSAK